MEFQGFSSRIKPEEKSLEAQIISELDRIGRDLEPGFRSYRTLGHEVHEQNPEYLRNIRKELRDRLITKYGMAFSEFITALTESFAHEEEWCQLVSHLLFTYRENPEIIRKF